MQKNLTTLQILHEKIHPGSDLERLLTSQKETELSVHSEGSRHLDLQRGLGMRFGLRMELPVSGKLEGEGSLLNSTSESQR